MHQINICLFIYVCICVCDCVCKLFIVQYIFYHFVVIVHVKKNINKYICSLNPIRFKHTSNKYMFMNICVVVDLSSTEPN